MPSRSSGHLRQSYEDSTLKTAAGIEYIYWLTLVGKSRVTGWRWRRPGPNGEPPRIHCFKIDNTWYVTAKEIKQFWARAEMGEFEGRPDGACSKPRHNAKKRRQLMTSKFATKLQCRRLRAIVKTIVLIPAWLVILPIRRDKAFRHYDERLDHLANTPFSRAAYIFSIVCWIVLIAVVVFEVHEVK